MQGRSAGWLILLSASAGLAAGCDTRPAGPAKNDSPIRFADVTAESGIDFRHRSGATGRRYFPEMMGAGCAVFDYDSDGWNDVFLAQGCPLPGTPKDGDWRCRLYRGGPGLRFVDVTDRAGVGGVGRGIYGMGCAVGDIDNDGHPDLLVNGFGGSILYRNRGDGTFADWTQRTGISRPGFWSSAAFLDFDRDGLLDLFSCRYVDYRIGDDEACNVTEGVHSYCSPKSFPGTASALYRNLGEGRFREVTRPAGVHVPTGKALGVVADDFDGNGWPDLYVANDTVRNLLFMNRGGRFTERGVEAGVAFGSAGVSYGGMGVDAGDLDGDLRPELMVTNFRLEPNTLFVNQDGRGFVENADSMGLTGDSRRWVGFGCGFEDFDLDGRLDALIVNGHVYDNASAFNSGDRTEQPPRLLHGLGGAFEPVNEAGPWFLGNYVARGLALGDLDNDGDVDAVVTTNDGPAYVLRNDSPRSANWLQARLEGTRSNRMGIGARVTLFAGGLKLRRYVRCAKGYQSSSDVRVTFGLGAVEAVERLEIEWPSGARTVVPRPAINQVVRLQEGRAAPQKQSSVAFDPSMEKQSDGITRSPPGP